jgi:hypothetical protein
MKGKDLLRIHLDAVNQSEPWHQWFAWYPVTIDNQKFWFKKVYRRRQWKTYSNWRLNISEWQYCATVFDLLRKDV